MNSQVWDNVAKAVQTPAGQARIKEILRAVLPFVAAFVPGAKVVSAVLPFVAVILDALGYVVAPKEVVPNLPPAPQTFGIDLNRAAAETAVRQAR